jgi:rubrerythrin
MSIVESLRKLVDPVQAENREEELQTDRELPKRAHPGDLPRFICRICGHLDTHSGYCPTCLADTMEPQPRAAEGPTEDLTEDLTGDPAEGG